MKNVNRLNFTVIIHLLIWVLVLLVPTIVFWGQDFGNLSQTFFFISTLFHIAFFYFNAYYLYPRFLNKKWWWLYIILLAGIFILFYFAKLFILEYSLSYSLSFSEKRTVLFTLLPFVIASLIFRLVKDRLHFEKREREVRAEKLAAELKFLRSQISPHFLFNMMANMVSLARQKSDLLEPSLIKLSELLRYMLYDSTEDKIELSREIEILKDYIALQQLRFGDDVQVDVNITSDFPECMIEPMLLIPFIENAFKHGIGLVKNPYITVNLNDKNKLLNFEVSNNHHNANLSKDKNSGIGLANVQNRLRLLYPQKHSLTIDDSSGVFMAHLKLDLV